MDAIVWHYCDWVYRGTPSGQRDFHGGGGRGRRSRDEPVQVTRAVELGHDWDECVSGADSRDAM